jgi:hypothetical protein
MDRGNKKVHFIMFQLWSNGVIEGLGKVKE